MDPTLDDLFERGRPAPHGLEIDQVLGSLRERFGAGSRPPVTIGRYRVAGRIGAGGLGIVYRGYDPSLARFVAIKVLKGGKEAAEQDVRLLREAQVLAKIRHPNVVEVFDVGFFEDHGRQRFFVAMELVEGTDLRRWLLAGRPLPKVRDAFEAAARGLHAAHAADLLHRDFKPSNVLMGDDGAIKVADFGLAAVTRKLQDDMGSGWSVPDGDATLTWRPGGTLHYMSPEQQRGEALTPASDQYSFCVSLHEAVYGHRPFDQTDRDAMLYAKQVGPQLSRDARVPRALRQLLARGLQPLPDDRFESMEALRAELARSSTPRRAWMAIGGLGVVSLGAAAAAMASRSDPAPTAEPTCAPRPASLADPEPFDAATTPAGPTTALPAMHEALLAYAGELRRRWDAGCSLDEQAQARVQQCLTQCGDAMVALHEVLARGERESLAQGWSLVRSLPDVYACDADGEGIEHGVVGAATSRSRMLITAGQLPEARRVLDQLKADPFTQDNARALRHLTLELAKLDATEGRYGPAGEAIERVYFEATSDDDTKTAASAAVWMVNHGYRSGDTHSALRWSRTAQTELERLQPRDYELEVALWHNRALTHLVAGDLTRALADIGRAKEHAEAPGVSRKRRRATLQVHAELLLLNGRPAEALQIHQAQLHTGEDHPQRDTMVSVVNLQSLGNTLMTLHDLDGAWTAYRSAYELGTTALGPAHPNTLGACISYAWSQGDRGDPELGQQTLEPCLARLVEQLGEGHPNTSTARAMAARLASQRGEAEAARRMFESALSSLEQNFGESHYVVGDVLHELGLARAAAGDHAAARSHLRRSLQIRERTLPEGHVNRAETMAQLSVLELTHGLGKRQPAVERLERAIALMQERQLGDDYIQTFRAHLSSPPQEPP